MSTGSEPGRLHFHSVDAISRQVRRDRRGQFPVLLFEPDLGSATQLAYRLEAGGFLVSIAIDAGSALPAVKQSFFFALVVVANLTDASCLAALRELRRAAMESWMIVATASCDVHACKLIHWHGGDACIVSPLSPDNLIERLDAFAIRTRPIF